MPTRSSRSTWDTPTASSPTSPTPSPRSTPPPTEDLGPDGDLLVERGAEFGATTGRQRRCGWFDAVIVRYAARVSSLTEIFLTKIDVLSAFDTIKVCGGYEH